MIDIETRIRLEGVDLKYSRLRGVHRHREQVSQRSTAMLLWDENSSYPSIVLGV